MALNVIILGFNILNYIKRFVLVTFCDIFSKKTVHTLLEQSSVHATTLFMNSSELFVAICNFRLYKLSDPVLLNPEISSWHAGWESLVLSF